MYDVFSGSIMRPLVILTVILIFCAETVGEIGENEELDLSNSPILSVESGENIKSNNEYEIKVLLNQAANENATEVEWITQICINSGVCYPPKSTILLKDEGDDIWKGTIIIDDDSSYINWKLELSWKNNTETSIPEQGFGWKVWSTCWYDAESDTWGGLDYPCDEENILPGFIVHTVIFSTIIGAYFYSNRTHR